MCRKVAINDEKIGKISRIRPVLIGSKIWKNFGKFWKTIHAVRPVFNDATFLSFFGLLRLKDV